MVPKKHKSKRLSLKTVHKIKKKAAEKRRKDRKEAKKNPQSKKLKKDPGIPALFPFKEKLLNQIEESKRKAEEEKARQKEARQKELLKRRQIGTAQDDMRSLAESAKNRGREFDEEHGSDFDSDSDGWMEGEVAVDGALSGRKDNSRKAYYKEFKKVVENADVILEVLDARDPMGTRAPHIERMILESGTNKRIILILNKIDLVPREVVEKWLKYLRHSFPTLAFKASTQEQRSNLGHSAAAASGGMNTSECVGADALIQLLKNYCRNQKIKTSVTVGAIGLPNVGKSSLINSLKRSRVCGVGSTPGFTKAVQEIHLDKTIKLLDCPGIVFSMGPSAAALNGSSDRMRRRALKKRDPKELAEIMLRNCVKVSLLEDPVMPVEVIVERCKPEALQAMYSVPPYRDTRDFLLGVAKQRGKIKRGGIPDIEGAARIVLTDWNTGKIPYYTLPPHIATGGSQREQQQQQTVVPGIDASKTKLVNEWTKEFDLGSLMGELDSKILGQTKSKGEFNKRFMVVEGPSAPIDREVEMHIEVPSSADEDGAGSSSTDDDSSEYMSAMDEELDEPATAAIQTPTPIVNLKVKSPKQRKVAVEDSEPVLNVMEKEINPQTNRQRKKHLKKEKKRASKQQQVAARMMGSDGEDDEAMIDEEYDFGEFYPKPGQNQQQQGLTETADQEDSDDDL